MNGEQESAAPLANIDKRLTSGIAVSPACAGTSAWSCDKHLQFTRKSDWLVDALFHVKIGNSQFYQDPQNPVLKKLVAIVPSHRSIPRSPSAARGGNQTPKSWNPRSRFQAPQPPLFRLPDDAGR